MGRCPARNASCFKCNLRGHYSSQCLSKSVTAASLAETNLGAAFLGVIDTTSVQKCTAVVQLGHQPVEFKLDTGAEVTTILEQVYKTLPRVKLLKASKVLYEPSQQRLKMLGQFMALLSVEERKSYQAVFVVRDLNCRGVY